MDPEERSELLLRVMEARVRGKREHTIAQELGIPLAMVRELSVEAVEQNLSKVAAGAIAQERWIAAAQLEAMIESVLPIALAEVTDDAILGAKVSEDDIGAAGSEYEARRIKATANAKRAQLWAVDRMNALVERRSKLLGLDPPTKTAATDPTGEFPAVAPPTLESVLEGLRRKMLEEQRAVPVKFTVMEVESDDGARSLLGPVAGGEEP